MRKILGLVVATSALLASSRAHATNITEFPDNGSEQLARGGAWVARASDPLATQYNPAGLAGQPSRVTLQISMPFATTCFHRMRDPNDTTADTQLLEPADSQGRQFYPKVCNDLGTFPVPNVAFTIRATPRLGIGFLLNAPSGAAAQAWPEFQQTSSGQYYPASERYLATYTNAFFLTPQLAVGWEPVDNLRIGAGFIAGIANATFSNGSLSNNTGNADPRTNDIKATLATTSAFVPGFTVGALWSATPMLDVAGWYKFSAPVDASADVTTYANYYNVPQAVVTGNSAHKDCDTGNSTFDSVCGPGKGHVTLPIPMEAKLGVRLHKPRRGIALEGGMDHRRDPMAQDVWDVELNLTWANDSALDTLKIRFPDGTSAPALPVNGISGGIVPPNADVPHNYNDVFGVRLGGDYNAIPNKLAIRAGAFFESAAARSFNGQNIYMATDFMSGNRFGLSLGATLRIPLKKDAPPTQGGAIELSAGYMHMFVTDLSNDGTQTDTATGQGGIRALAGTACESGTPNASNVCSNGVQAFRTSWYANLGTITNSLDVINVGASYRF